MTTSVEKNSTQPAIQLLVTPAELAILVAATQDYRDLMASPVSAARDANGAEWADEEVNAAESLLQGKLARATQETNKLAA